jgi:hypothetical protein
MCRICMVDLPKRDSATGRNCPHLLARNGQPRPSMKPAKQAALLIPALSISPPDLILFIVFASDFRSSCSSGLDAGSKLVIIGVAICDSRLLNIGALFKSSYWATNGLRSPSVNIYHTHYVLEPAVHVQHHHREMARAAAGSRH